MNRIPSVSSFVSMHSFTSTDFVISPLLTDKVKLNPWGSYNIPHKIQCQIQSTNIYKTDDGYEPEEA